MLRIFTFVVLALSVGHLAFAQPQIVLEPFASGLSSPLNLSHVGDNRLFVVQQRGLIRIVDNAGNVLPSPFHNLSNKVSTSGGERGLLGLAFHPTYHSNGYFYVNYTRESDGATIVSRFSVNPTNANRADTASEMVLLTIPQPFANHNGGDIRFGPDGYLYIALGDGGSGGDPQNYAQNENSLLGKMLRIDVDNGSPYGIPSTNPFVNDASVRDEIWALGLRNHWRNSFDSYTGDLWIADVGQSLREEVNFQPATSTGGENYGWRCYEGSLPYNTTGCEPASTYVFPVFEYDHTGISCSGSITGGYVYRGALYNGMFGKYFAADYCKGNFYWIEQNDTGFTSGHLGTFSPFQYSSFGEDLYGELYVTLLGNGLVQRLTDTSDCRPVAMIKESNQVINQGDSVILSAFFHPSLNYKWKNNGSDIQGATSHFININQAGSYTVEVTNPSNACTNLSRAVEVTVRPVSAKFISKIHNVNIYPNPAKGEITISGLPENVNVIIEVHDLTGKSMISYSGITPGSKSLDMGNLSSGIYFLKVMEGGNYVTKKVVVE